VRVSSHKSSTPRPSFDRVRVELADRLRGRWAEIEQAAMARLHGVSAPSSSIDPAYAEGLRAAASAALAYLLAGVERGDGCSPPPPAAVLIQARLAARNSVSLDTVLRRCFAGFTLFGDFLMQEAEQGELMGGAVPKRLLRTQAALFDRLIAAVTEEYMREAGSRLGSAEERRAEYVRRLLAGEPLDTTELAYDLEAHHLGAIAVGPGAEEEIRTLAGSLDRRLLAIRHSDGAVWAWFGGRHPTDPEELRHLVCGAWPSGISLAIGEPGEGRGDWRLTHRQARAALPIALRSADPLVRYAEVALLASVRQDDLLATSLRQLYLVPLESERDGGEVARVTLRAYFAAERNASSAAALLGVSRQAVNNRLRAIEELLGRPLGVCGTEMEIALSLEKPHDPPALSPA
jgi:hypothetical protein